MDGWMWKFRMNKKNADLLKIKEICEWKEWVNFIISSFVSFSFRLDGKLEFRHPLSLLTQWVNNGRSVFMLHNSCVFYFVIIIWSFVYLNCKLFEVFNPKINKAIIYHYYILLLIDCISRIGYHIWAVFGVRRWLEGTNATSTICSLT